MAKRKLIRINVTPAAKEVIERWAAEHDMKEIGVASRIYEWFGRQADDVQRAILGLYGDRAPDIIPMILGDLKGRAAAENGGSSKTSRDTDAPTRSKKSKKDRQSA